MRLLSLRLRNFRQHADTEITFRGGLTGIIGPNGAGKSTLLEGIAWAIYGSAAARGTNDTIRFARAGARARVEVELGFSLGGHEYRVVRTLNNAEVFLDGGLTPVAASLGGVTAYLQTRIGMSREEFFNTYFTGQKELQFLATMGPTERGRFLSQVLGYERLRRAQDLARTRRSELRSEIKGLRASLGDADEVRSARTLAERRMSEALTAYSAAQTAQVEAGAVVREIAPRWEAAELARDRHRELSQAIVTAESERDVARRDILRAEADLATVTSAEAELAPLRAQLAVLPALSSENERLEDLARKEERRRALSDQAAELELDVERGRERVAKVSRAPVLERQYSVELAEFREERIRVEAELEEQKTAWLRDKQDAQTKLQNYRDRGLELKEQLRQIQQLGPEGKCPTCGRPVGADFERLLEELDEQWHSVVQDGKWWSSRAEQLQDKPEDVAALEVRLRALGELIDEKARKHTRCEAAVQELHTLQKEQTQRESRRAELMEELRELPTGYDASRHREVEELLRALRGVETRAARLEETTARRDAWERDLLNATVHETAAGERVAALTAERTSLRFSDAAFATLRTEYEAASDRFRAAELRATELRGEVSTAEQGLQTAQRAEAEYLARAAEVHEREADLGYHEELDLALSDLRSELNAQVRPELSEIASAFLAQLTDGRYTSMEIDDAYNLMVLDEGEEKPVISGGEEDIANLVLRLSLSQMIAERAGHPLSLLILDEVFGSLDVARRDNVVALLHHLEDRFEQVILITHVEGIRESLDQVLRVGFDERAGTSVVHEESLPGEERPETDIAAD